MLFKDDVYQWGNQTALVPSFIVQDPNSPLMTVYTNKTDDLGWYVVEVTASLTVIDLLGDLVSSNDPDHTPSFLNTWLNDPVTG